MTISPNAATSAPLFRLPDALHHETMLYLTPVAARTLSKTCHHFQKLWSLPTESMLQRRLAVQYPLFRRPHEANNYSAQYYLDRLAAAHSPSPGIFRRDFFTLPMPPQCLQLTPDGTKYLVGMENPASLRGIIELYDLTTGRCLWSIDIPRRASCLEVSANGKTALATYGQATLAIDLENGTELNTHIHDHSIARTLMGPDEETVYAMGVYDQIESWSLTTGTQGKIFQNPTSDGFIPLISRDGTTAISSLTNGKILFWELETGKILQILERHLLTEHRWIEMPTAISADKTMAISTSNQAINIWDLQTGSCLKRIKVDTIIRKIQVTPDMTKAVLGDTIGNIILVDLTTRLKQNILGAHATEIRGLQITADGREVISCAADGTVHRWTLSRLPEHRLTRLARQCLTNAKEELTLLPKFARKDIKALHSITCNWQQSVDIYTTQTALGPFKRLFERAINEPLMAPKLVCEAINRIDELSPSIKKAIHKHGKKILARKKITFEQVSDSPKSVESFLKDGTVAKAGIQAIELTVTEFGNKLQQAQRRRERRLLYRS